MFRLNKKKIFVVYQYYLYTPLAKRAKSFLFPLSNSKKKDEIFAWRKEFLSQEEKLRKDIENKLKSSWIFPRILPLERAILMYTAYEVSTQPHIAKVILDQAINFSQTYLEKDKHKYINKILDLFTKTIISIPAS